MANHKNSLFSYSKLVGGKPKQNCFPTFNIHQDNSHIDCNIQYLSRNTWKVASLKLNLATVGGKVYVGDLSENGNYPEMWHMSGQVSDHENVVSYPGSFYLIKSLCEELGDINHIQKRVV